MHRKRITPIPGPHARKGARHLTVIDCREAVMSDEQYLYAARLAVAYGYQAAVDSLPTSHPRLESFEHNLCDARELAGLPRLRPLALADDHSGAAKVHVWEARAEHNIGVFIARYLSEHPSPGASTIRSELARWGNALRGDGEARLASMCAPVAR
ncbi:MAG: hypothetical protein JWQ48_197 [Conexibacter sp.]|nr:hypothetical protein [Conexibacter sp.]